MKHHSGHIFLLCWSERAAKIWSLYKWQTIHTTIYMHVIAFSLFLSFCPTPCPSSCVQLLFLVRKHWGASYIIFFWYGVCMECAIERKEGHNNNILLNSDNKLDIFILRFFINRQYCIHAAVNRCIGKVYARYKHDSTVWMKETQRGEQNVDDRIRNSPMTERDRPT